MSRVLLGLSACVLGLMLAGEASAAPSGPHGRSHGSVRRSSHVRHGVRFSGGYYYPGRAQRHWSRRVWSPVYHRYQYLDPTLRVWYYYDDARVGYYPCP